MLGWLTSFALDPTKTRVVGQKNAPSSRVTAGPARESTTVLMGGNADGEKLPPLIVFKGKNVWDTWMAPHNPRVPQPCYAASSNGWMESDIFFNYFEKTFLKSCGSERPILLIYDGHTTHIDERVIKCAIDNDIINYFYLLFIQIFKFYDLCIHDESLTWAHKKVCSSVTNKAKQFFFLVLDSGVLRLHGHFFLFF